jgi:cysteinyl-tRNA synthetase
MVDGQKMSKSLGNFYTLRDILERGYTGREIRWVLLGTHYRQSLNFSFKALEEARTALQRLDALKTRLKENQQVNDNNPDQNADKLLADSIENFKKALCDDLNISAALAALFDLLRELNKLMDDGKCLGVNAKNALETLAKMDTVLAVLEPDHDDQVPQEIQQMAEDRQAARKAKDFATADELRKKLDELGWVVEDTPKGPRVKKK